MQGARGMRTPAGIAYFFHQQYHLFDIRHDGMASNRAHGVCPKGHAQ